MESEFQNRGISRNIEIYLYIRWSYLRQMAQCRRNWWYCHINCLIEREMSFIRHRYGEKFCLVICIELLIENNLNRRVCLWANFKGCFVRQFRYFLDNNFIMTDFKLNWKFFAPLILLIHISFLRSIFKNFENFYNECKS